MAFAKQVRQTVKLLSKTNGKAGIFAAAKRFASNRNYPVGGGSNETNITEEVRDLIRKVRHAENVEEWERSDFVEDPIVVKPFRPNHDQDVDDDQGFDLEYWPHRGELNEGLWAEKAKGNFEPPLVLLAEKTDSYSIGGTRWWQREVMEKLGLGEETWEWKVVAVPNMTFYTSLLFQVRHLVKITPVSFPNGIPAEEDFDENAVTVTNDGRFIYHPKIGEQAKELRQAEERGEAMALQDSTVRRKCRDTWNLSMTSPLGNSNYNRDTRLANPEVANRATDYIYKVKY